MNINPFKMKVFDVDIHISIPGSTGIFIIPVKDVIAYGGAQAESIALKYVKDHLHFTTKSFKTKSK